jgi:hypothetical protein
VTDNELLDHYRDRNVFAVYRCLTCGFRGIGASVTLHPYEHGPMARERMAREHPTSSTVEPARTLLEKETCDGTED